MRLFLNHVIKSPHLERELEFRKNKKSEGRTREFEVSLKAVSVSVSHTRTHTHCHDCDVWSPVSGRGTSFFDNRRRLQMLCQDALARFE
jgi:hypothetical protein